MADADAIRAFEASFGRSIDGRRMLCVGCSATGRCQLGVNAVELTPDGALRATITSPRSFEGGPGVVHGGWTAATFDEVLAQLTALRGLLTVTSELSVRYHRPIPVARELVLDGRVMAQHAGRWTLAGEMRLPRSQEPLASATGTWLERDFGHFTRHRQWLAERDELEGA